MPVTRLSDVIVPQVFFNYMAKDTTEKTAIFRSGILRSDAELAGKLGGGGTTFNVPFWNDLDNTEAGVANDDPAANATPGNVGTGKDIARRQVRTRGWSTADLAGVMAGADPLQRIQTRVVNYWDRQFQRVLTNTLTGVLNSNVTNNSGDFVNDISNDNAATVTAAELVSAEAIIDTKYTSGDAEDVFKVIIMHSTVKKRLEKLNLIDFIPDSEGHIVFERYLGLTVVVDDGVKRLVKGTDTVNRTKYYTYIVGPGALGFAEVPPPTPVEVQRYASQGNGMGVEQLWTRRQYVMHPYGVKWTDSSVSGQFPVNADLANGSNWTRVYAERKQIPISALITNG